MGLSQAGAPQAAQGGAWWAAPAPLARELPKDSGTPNTCRAQLRPRTWSACAEDTEGAGRRRGSGQRGILGCFLWEELCKKSHKRIRVKGFTIRSVRLLESELHTVRGRHAPGRPASPALQL